NITTINNIIENYEYHLDNLRYDCQQTVDKGEGLAQNEYFIPVSKERFIQKRDKYLKKISELEHVEKWHLMKTIVMQVIRKSTTDKEGQIEIDKIKQNKSTQKRLKYYGET